jgi:hypothetical protein
LVKPDLTKKERNRMVVRDLNCWPPTWRRDSRVSGQAASGESGVLIAVRWDLKNQLLALTMEDEGDRHSAVLEDEVKVLTKLYLLLGWHVGRPLATLGGLEIAS